MTVNGKQWADQNVDDNDDEIVMEVDSAKQRSAPVDDEVPLEGDKFYHDCEEAYAAASSETTTHEESAAPAMCNMTAFRRRKSIGSESGDASKAAAAAATSAAEEATANMQKEFDAKMAQLEQQRQGTHATTAATQETLDKRELRHKKNMDAMYGQIQALQDKLAAQQAASDARLTAIEESFRNFQTQTLTAQAAAAAAAAAAAKVTDDRFENIMVALGKLQQSNATPPPAATKTAKDATETRRDRSHSPRRESARSVVTNS